MARFAVVLVLLAGFFSAEARADASFKIKNCLKQPISLSVFKSDDQIRLWPDSTAPGLGYGQETSLSCTADSCAVSISIDVRGSWVIGRQVQSDVCVQRFGTATQHYHELVSRSSILCDPPYC